ncbi:hypothetical protein ELE36_14670 [Pseudolysobacter antarcticus]|uniref:Uncharacterized protein n=1 Tax=Pseudolysobacter antarcticus TaxID=2511995 RepID=A0A411HLY4_9GAMM|nr:hypothetical protein [Pseudolysobacter antarcticus]QBB71498.1 hypothetical protein ELE36_14670 [Pseudolysobacter antarcticus]
MRFFITLVMLLCLSACAKPVPADKAAFVGEWKSPEMYLQITQAGHVDYKRSIGSGSKSVSGPLQGFSGENFDVGIGAMSTTFVVTTPPHQDGGTIKMTVDGVELSKTP